jgi:DNA-binding MarR family transcriptional regulator
VDGRRLSEAAETLALDSPATPLTVSDHEEVPDMAEAPWLDAGEQRAWRAFLDVRRELLAELNRRLSREAGLSGADYELLVPLSETPEGRLRPRDLGRRVLWDRSRLSHQIRRMQERGLVVREECCTDGRGAFIVLTDQGRQAIESAAPDHVRSVRHLFLDALQPGEIDTLIAIYDRILDRIRRHGSICSAADPGPDEDPCPDQGLAS